MPEFSKSNQMFKKVRQIIPLASQTFSKSHLQYVGGRAPLFIERGKGAYVWDIDGNKYLDMINGLLPVVLGYQYKAVDDAIKVQMKKGIIFSLPSLLEYELAKELKNLIPCAEMVRFGKNGSDATAGAVRLARAVTKRDHIAVCGYHGWQDWYIGVNPRNAGVPEAVKKLVHKFEYNNIKSLEAIFKEYEGKMAAVIMEPMNYEDPRDNFLQKVKELAHKNKALLIFDEVITGFRYNLGGAQKMFKVIPDLATFGKSLGNGMPISAVVGKAEYMKEMENIFFSFTFGGECLSLVASLAVIREMKKRKVIEYLWKIGEYVKIGTEKLIKKNSLEKIISVKGKPCWHLLDIKDHNNATSMEIKSFIQEKMIESGILWFGQHNMSFSHTKKDMDKVLAVYGEAFSSLKELLSEDGGVRKKIKGVPIKGNYNVRKM